MKLLFGLAALLHDPCLPYLHLILPGVSTSTVSGPWQGAATQTAMSLPQLRSTPRSAHLLLNLNIPSTTSTTDRLQIAIDSRQKKGDGHHTQPTWPARLDTRTGQAHLTLHPPHASLPLARSGVPVQLAILKVATPQGNRAPTSLSTSWVSFEASANRPPLPKPPSRQPPPEPSPSARRGQKGK